MLEFLLCLLITVSIHELAHMLVALKCGIGVKVFSVGFGRPFLHKKIKGIDFRLSPLPFGGYVDIQGMDSKNNSRDFLAHPYRHKFIVLIAGVTANILLAFICYLIHYGSISIGLKIDWIFLKAMFTQDYSSVEYLMRLISLNFFLIQLSVLNIFCGIANLIPIIPLDGGLIWYYLIENKLSKVVKNFLFISGWTFVIGIQIWLIYWIYFVK